MNARNGVAALVVALALCVAAIMSVRMLGANNRATAEDVTDAPVLVELTGTSMVACYNERAYSPVYRHPSDPPLVMLLRDGDILLMTDEEDECGYLLPYRRQDDGQTLDLWSDGPVLRVNLLARCLNLDEEGLEWLSRAPDAHLADLRFVVIHELPSDAVVPLRRLARVNPHVGLGFGSLDDDLDWPESLGMTPEFVDAFAEFRPRTILISAEVLAFLKLGEAMMESDPTEEDLEFLASWSSDQARKRLLASWASMEILITSAETPSGLQVLSDLPNLRSLVLFEWDPGDTGPMPAGLASLTSLHLFCAESRDLQALSELTGLQHLNISWLEDLEDLSAVQVFPALRSIDLSYCDEEIDLEPLFALRSLEHVGLPASTTQAQLTELAARLPGLKSLGLVLCEDLEDLAPLASLAELECLAVGELCERVAAANFRHLRYLEIVSGDEEDQEIYQIVAALREALPDCQVVTSAGICLGSGYLLLLLPAVVLARMVSTRGRSRARPTT